jgi:hypothetical protein
VKHLLDVANEGPNTGEKGLEPRALRKALEVAFVGVLLDAQNKMRRLLAPISSV